MPYLYIIRCNEFYKIGVASDVQTRLAQLQTGNPHRLEVVRYYEFVSPEPVEKSIHQKFSAKRGNGEWFLLSTNDLRDVDAICNLLGGVKHHESITASDESVSDADEQAALTDFLPEDEIPQGAWIELVKHKRGNGDYSRPYYKMRWREGNVRRSTYLGVADDPTP